MGAVCVRVCACAQACVLTQAHNDNHEGAASKLNLSTSLLAREADRSSAVELHAKDVVVTKVRMLEEEARNAARLWLKTLTAADVEADVPRRLQAERSLRHEIRRAACRGCHVLGPRHVHIAPVVLEIARYECSDALAAQRQRKLGARRVIVRIVRAELPRAAREAHNRLHACAVEGRVAREAETESLRSGRLGGNAGRQWRARSRKRGNCRGGTEKARN